jgi:hypothetical protein
MGTPDPAPDRSQRFLRVAALALLSLFIAPILVIFAIRIDYDLLSRVPNVFNDPGLKEQTLIYIVVPLLVLLAAGIFFVFWKLVSRSWTRIACAYGSVALLLAYLSHDEPTYRHPMTMEDISPVFPGEEASYNLLMLYGRQHPLGKSFTQPEFKKSYPRFVVDEAWRETVTTHRQEIEAHWADLSKERAWWNELSGFVRIGDLMAANWDGEILTFQIFRTMTQHSLAIASLQAIDGHGDQAIDTLLPTLEVGRKLPTYSRTLVRAMIAVVIEKMSIATANFILDTTPVSPEARARLAAALKGGDPEAGARHLMNTEYALHLGWMTRARIGYIFQVLAPEGTHRNILFSYLNCFSPLFYLPKATFNRIGDLYADWGDLVAQRKFDGMNARWEVFDREISGLSLKNPLGRDLAARSIPVYEKVAKNYWSKEDLRTALLARLAKP